MKLIVVLFLFITASMRASEPVSAGDWSAPVNGLRGRLVLSEDKPYNGTRIALVYLELQNVADNLGPLLLDYHSPHLDLIDADGKSVEQSHTTEDVFGVGLPTLVLPFDSTLRFRISVTGYGLSHNAGLVLQLPSACWVIPQGSRAKRFLTGSLEVPALDKGNVKALQKDLDRGINGVWHGTIRLPKLKIPSEQME
jgi:hypothetical protein